MYVGRYLTSSVYSSNHDNLNQTTIIADVVMVNNIVMISGIARLNNKYTKTHSLLDKIFRPKFDINFRFFKNVSNEENYNFSTHQAVLHTDGTFGIAGDSHEGASFFTLAYLL